ncbi:MAG TPA: ABC transporter ATP-binding protein [Actinocrinis sp.]|nr:ABC transporter ATP-binding protein [Actinocrinis sp.]
MAEVRFIDATRVFRGSWKPAVAGVGLEVRDGELVVLTGASGSGKSTLLRMLAGLEPLDRGQILLGGQDLARVAPDKRGVALLAQGFALFPHLSVAENIAFPLTMRKTSAKAAQSRVAQLAEQCGLAGHLADRPESLSVDLRQRAIMARAMVTRPRVICLDEPLAGASVPAMLRDRTPIATLQRECGITMLFATCSSTDAWSIADRIAVMDRGVVHQVDSPHTVFEQPGTVAVAEFVGAPPMNLIPAVVRDGSALLGSLRIPVAAEQLDALSGDRIVIGLWPDDLVIGPGAGAAGIRATAVLIKDSGRDYLVHARIEVPDGSADVVIRRATGPVPLLGEDFMLTATVDRVHLFDAATGRRLP